MTALFHILIVDPSCADRVLFETAFAKRQGVSTTAVATAGEALDYLKGAGVFSDKRRFPPPCLILSETRLPEKDGFALLSEIRLDPELRAIPVVFLTADNQRDQIDKAYDLGASSFLRKPSSLAEIQETACAISEFWTHAVTRYNQRSLGDAGLRR